MAKKCISIMVVDDHDASFEEYEVIGEARNASIAVEMADRLKPDIICLDVIMRHRLA